MINPEFESGCYIFSCKLEKAISLQAGARPPELFKSGFYFYVGRAKKNLTKRLGRHFLSEKKCRWHIDYLSSITIPSFAMITPHLDECKISRHLANHGDTILIRGFGASDCKCRGHLHFSENEISVNKIKEIFSNSSISLYTFIRPKSGIPENVA